MDDGDDDEVDLSMFADDEDDSNASVVDRDGWSMFAHDEQDLSMLSSADNLTMPVS